MGKFKHAFVITGSIGSGKSTVCNILKLYGFKVIDADEISHRVLDDLHSEIALEFGTEFVENGKVLRKKLGNLVFNDKEKMQILENLLHPRIKAEILQTCNELEKTQIPYFVDIPLFFEKANYSEFDKVVVVYAPKEVLISRISKRNSLTENEALVRINLQIDTEKKRELANFVIDNSSDFKALNKEIDKFLLTLKSSYKNLKI